MDLLNCTSDWSRKISLLGNISSTLKNYSRHLGQMALHFNCLPTELDEKQGEDYLHLLQQQHNTPSDSFFKHMIYRLRLLFRVEGLKQSIVTFPFVKHEKKLPVILSREDVKQLLLNTECSISGDPFPEFVKM